MRRAMTRARPAKLRNPAAAVKRFTISLPHRRPLQRGEYEACPTVAGRTAMIRTPTGEVNRAALDSSTLHTPAASHHVKNKSSRLGQAASGHVVERVAMIGCGRC